MRGKEGDWDFIWTPFFRRRSRGLIFFGYFDRQEISSNIPHPQISVRLEIVGQSGNPMEDITVMNSYKSDPGILNGKCEAYNYSMTL
jgi:hypothetical protein